MRKVTLLFLFMILASNLSFAQKYIDDWMVPSVFNSECYTDYKNVIKNKCLLGSGTSKQLYTWYWYGSFIDMMQPYYVDDSIKIKGITVFYISYKNNLNAFVGIQKKDSVGNFSIIQQKEFKVQKSKDGIHSYIAEILFDSVVEVSDTFYVYVDVPKPLPIQDSNIYNWKYTDDNYQPFLIVVTNPFELCEKKIDSSCVPDLKMLFRYNEYNTKNNLTTLDSVWYETICDNSFSVEKFKFQEVQYMLYTRCPMIFPILWNGPTMDTVIKGGATIQGEITMTENIIQSGDTTITQYLSVQCDTIIAPDTVIMADNQLDTIINGSIQNIICDTTITYDTIIESNLLSVNEQSIEIFPNPTDDNITIKSNTNILSIDIINSLGQTIKTVQVNKNSVTLSVKNYKKGTYIVNIHTSTGIIQKKFVVK